MTDNLGQGDPGNPSPDAGAGGVAAPAAPAVDWKAGFDEDVANHPSMSDFKNPGDLAKSWVNAQKIIGADKIALPGENATPEEWSLVFDKLGRPANHEGYVLPEVTLPEGMPPPDEGMLKAFKEQCHANGILPGQASKLFEWWQTTHGTVFEGMMTERGQNQQTAETSLRSEWGKAYEPNLAKAQSVLKQFGDEKLTEYLESSGAGNDPHLIRFLANIGKNFGEDALTGRLSNFTKSPAEAQAEINSVLADKNGAYFHRDNPEHQMMVKKMEDLHKQAYPESTQGQG